MAKWNAPTVTSYGKELLAKALTGTCAIEFVGVSIGSGLYSEDEKLSEFLESQEDLRETRNEYGISSFNRNGKTVILKVLIDNATVTEGYHIREMGVWAKEKGSEKRPKLYSVVVAKEADYFPDNSTAVTIKQVFCIVFSNKDVNVSIAENMGAYVLADDFRQAVQELKKSVSDGKKNVADAITEMGVETESTEDSPAAFATLAGHIRDITPTLTLQENTAKAKVGSNEVTQQIGYPMGGENIPGTSDKLLVQAGTRAYFTSDYKMKSLGGNADAAHVLTGKTFSSNISGREKAGTMVNQGAKTASLNCGGTYKIPAGYHNGSGKVTANSLASQITTAAVYDKYKHTEKVLATCPVDLTSANCHYNGNDAIYLIGGNNGKQTTRYNIKDNTYTTLSAAPQNILFNSSVMLGNQIICFGESKRL